MPKLFRKVRGRVIGLWVINKQPDGRKIAPNFPDDYLIPVRNEQPVEQYAEVEVEVKLIAGPN